MIKWYFLVIGAMALLTVACSTDLRNPIEENVGFYDLKVRKLNSTDSLDFSSFKGKKVVLVNVASKCGYTYQYEGLESLYREYKENVVVLGLPCNQFLFQEPGEEDSIARFCSKVYDVTFPMTEKIYVKGAKQHPIYQWLTQKSLNGKDDYEVTWNFNKFVIDENGKLIGYFDSKVKPLDDEIIDLLKS